MNYKVRRLLIAVADGSAKKVVDRAVQLAGSARVQVELFSVVRPPPPLLGMTRIDDRRYTQAAMAGRRQQLSKLAARLRLSGIDAACTVAANSSVAEGIVRRVRDSKADLVAIEAHKHNLLARLFVSQNDYDLIRECPVPLLIVKGGGKKPAAPILAALDPWHSNSKPQSLDNTIVTVARGIAATLKAPLHSAHAYSSLMGFVVDSTFAPVSMPISMPEEKRYAAAVRRHFAAANSKYKITSRHAHLRMGDPAFVLPALARTIKAQMLVMGAISRSAMNRILIGSTAERILDAMPCDILIVKPRGLRYSIK